MCVSGRASKFLTASSHKIYGPKGAACLYKKEGIIINKDGDWNHILFTLWFNKFEWMTNLEFYNQLSQDLQEKFSRGTNADDYILNTTDLIADTIEFMNSVVSEFEKRGLL